MRNFLMAVVFLGSLLVGGMEGRAQARGQEAAAVSGDPYLDIALSLCKAGAAVPIGGQSLSFEEFRKNGTVAGVGLGDDMNKAMKAWGTPERISCGHGGTRWWHDYRNMRVEYQYGKLRQITVGAPGQQGEFMFDNGISNKSTRGEVIKILGQPKGQGMTGLSYPVGNSEYESLSLVFLLHGQFPKTPEDWEKATLSSIARQSRILKAPAGVAVANEGFFASSSALISSGAKAPLAGKKLDFAQFQEQGTVAGITLENTMVQVVGVWGKPDRISTGGPGTWWVLGYENATLMFNDDKLAQITLGSSVGVSDFDFDNGVVPGMTMPRARAAMGIPKRKAELGEYPSSTGKYVVRCLFAADEKAAEAEPVLYGVSVCGPMR